MPPIFTLNSVIRFLDLLHLDARLGDAALAGARVLDDDEGVLAAPRQVLLRLAPARLQP